MTPTTTTPSTNDSLALQFFEAVLKRDARALRAYGVSKDEATAINIETQIVVAAKLLQFENTKTRSVSKRVQAAEALKAPPAAATVPPAPKAQFHSTIPTSIRSVAS